MVREVRADLWNAILDYRSGKRYVWDGSAAVPEGPDPLAQMPILPTVSDVEFIEWKQRFAESHRKDSDEDLNRRLSDWATKNQPTRALPVRLQGAWNATLKTRVLERLQSWFQERNLTPPVELAPTNVVDRRKTPENQAVPSQIEEFRRVVLDCIRAMTYKELLDLRIPMSAVARLQSRSPK